MMDILLTGRDHLATEWLPDTFGPDNVRVTIGIEPAVERLVRGSEQWGVPGVSLLPGKRRLWNLLPAVVQEKLFNNSWAVVIEADSGERVRLTRVDRAEALGAARSLSDVVRDQGVAALASLR
jgi:hypothetical protein